MPLLKVDLAKISHTSGILSTSVSGTLLPELRNLKASVSQLLSAGMLLKATSPEMEQSYTDFDVSLTKAISSIENFSAQFKSIGDSVNELDLGIKNQILQARANSGA